MILITTLIHRMQQLHSIQSSSSTSKIQKHLRYDTSRGCGIIIHKM